MKVQSDKDRLIAEIKQAVKEMKLIKSGKKKARNADEFLSDLDDTKRNKLKD